MNKFVVFGLGAIGSNLLKQLSNIYPKAEFIGIDFDTVEDRNIATQAYMLPHIGMKKALAMQIVLGLNNRNSKFKMMTQKIISKDMARSLIITPDTLGIDCFDNSESRKLLEGFDNVLHVGFNPKYVAEIIWGKDYTAPNDIDPEENDICEMASAVPFINYVVSMASFTINDYISTGEQNNYLISDRFKLRRM